MQPLALCKVRSERLQLVVEGGGGQPSFLFYVVSPHRKVAGEGGELSSSIMPALAGGETLAEKMGLFWCGWIAAGVEWGGMATDLLVVSRHTKTLS